MEEVKLKEYKYNIRHLSRSRHALSMQHNATYQHHRIIKFNIINPLSCWVGINISTKNLNYPILIQRTNISMLSRINSSESANIQESSIYAIDYGIKAYRHA